MRESQWTRPNTWLHTRPYEPLATVDRFHQTFGVTRYWDIPMNPDGTETEAHSALRALRARLILEEALEAIEALGFHAEVDSTHEGSTLFDIDGFVLDEEHLAKELADVKVVTYGTDDVMSIPGEDVYNEVMRSNMSKVGDDGKPIRREDGKVLKGPNYKAPDVNGALTGNWL